MSENLFILQYETNLAVRVQQVSENPGTGWTCLCTSRQLSVAAALNAEGALFHLPPFTLKLNLPGLYPLTLDSGRTEKRSRICVKTPVYVAGLERGVLPMGLWSMLIALSIWWIPLTDFTRPTRFLER